MHQPSDSKDRVLDELRSLKIERSRDNPSRRINGVALAATLSLLAAGFALIWWKVGPDRSSGPIPVEQPSSTSAEPTTRSTATPIAPSQWVVAGFLVARRESLVSAEITANVAELLVSEGMMVKKGAVIAKLDGTLAEADLRIARTEVEVATHTIEAIEAELAEAKVFLARTRRLSNSGATSETDLSKAESRFATLSARQRQSEAEHQMAIQKAERAEAVLAKHTILAPFSGIVTDCSVEVGETISIMSSSGTSNDGICTIIDPSSIEVELDVPETLIGRVQIGAGAEVALDAYPDEAFAASVKMLAPIANREKATIRVRLAFQKFDPRFRPEMAVKATLHPSEVTQ